MYLGIPEKLNTIIAYAKEEAIRLGSLVLTTDHLILGMIRHSDNMAVRRLVELGIDISEMKQSIEEIIRREDVITDDKARDIALSSASTNALKIMYLEARSLHETQPGSIHLLLAIMRGPFSSAIDYLHMKGIYYETVKSRFTGFHGGSEPGPQPQLPEIPGEEGDPISHLFDKLFNGNVEHPKGESEPQETDEGDFQDEGNAAEMERRAGSSDAERGANTRIKKGSSTPVLDSFGFDFTKAAKNGELDPVVGREKEIERVAQILGRRKKNNPILIGEPGVGKSAIAEGLANKIANGEVPYSLAGKKIVSLDIGSIVAGTKYRGQFEERMKSILNELKKNDDVILFIDEIHTLVGAGGAAGSLDAANMLKPALARGEIQCIGATTLDEFREVIEKDGALERRFQKVMVEPTDFDQTLDILQHIKQRYESHHNVVFTDEALRSCIHLTQRYISDRCLPDKAVDVMDEAGSRAHIKNMKVPKSVVTLEEAINLLNKEKRAAAAARDFRQAAMLRDVVADKQRELAHAKEKWRAKQDKNPVVVTKEDIEAVLSMTTKIPLQKLAESESNKLMNMGKVLKESIIGQDEAVDKVTRAIMRNRAGLKDPNKPIGSFLFLGPTGVGKTQLAKVLARKLFDTEEALIRIDMSEFMEKFSVSRLIGAPPGYVGYNEGGELSEKVRRKPYSVVLLDEIEKAHPDIYNLLLQVLDEGRITDSSGRFIDFKNTILILTSNVGTKELKDNGPGVGYATATKRNIAAKNKEIIDKAIKEKFSPEFLNRLDEQIHFNPLTKDDLEKIIDIELKGLYKRIESIGYKVRITSAAKKFVANTAYDPQYGARPLKRAIQKLIEDPLSEAIISKRFKEGETVTLGLKNKEIVVQGYTK